MTDKNPLVISDKFLYHSVISDGFLSVGNSSRAEYRSIRFVKRTTKTDQERIVTEPNQKKN